MLPQLIGAGVGALLGGIGGSKQPREFTSTQQGTQTSQWTPHPAALPMYSWLGATVPRLLEQPTPYPKWKTYVGPSEETQKGIETGMSALPWYQQGADVTGQGIAPTTQGAQQLMQGADTIAQAAGTMDPMLQQMQQNYGMLSGAADVANNPYVQAQLAANQQQVTQALQENWLPQINQGAQAVNALGSARHGLAQAQGVERAAQQLANQNAATMLQAYGQGLGAQQAALGQTGGVLQNLLAPGQALGQAGQMYGGAGQMYGGAGQLAGTAGDWLNRGGQAGLAYGQRVEDYQQRALQDRLNRFYHRFEEPWQRVQRAMGTLGAFQPMGTSTVQTSGTSTAPNTQRIGGFGGALQGGMMGLSAGSRIAGLFR